MYDVDEKTGEYPFGNILTPGNGTGKTHLMALVLCGWTKGSSYLNRSSWPEDALEFFERPEIKRKRDAGSLSIRIVCDGDDMKEGGSVHDAIVDLIPDAKPMAKESGGCYRQVRIPHPELEGVFNTLSVRTFGQEVRQHAGTNVDFLAVNEPMPHPLWGENIGRLRSKRGDIQGSFALFATVLNQAPYVSDMVEQGGVSGHGRIVHSKGSIWENCVGSELPEEKAKEIERRYGYKIPRDAESGEYLTGGVLTRASIEGQIRTWKSTVPHELDGREWGDFIHLEGRLLQLFGKDTHVVSSSLYRELPVGYPVVQIVDPHDRKPDLSIWATITPRGRLAIIGEHPNLPYVHIKDRTDGISQTCEVWRNIEAARGWTDRIVARIGDPNKFNDKDPATGQSLWQLYSACGFKFNTQVNDDNDIGLRELNDWLYFDPIARTLNPDDPMGQPRLVVCDDLHNVIEGCFKCAWREHRDPNAAVSTKIDPKYKHVFDVLRYLVMWMKKRSYSELRSDVPRESEVEILRKARMGSFGNRSTTSAPTFASKGRNVIETVGA